MAARVGLVWTGGTQNSYWVYVDADRLEVQRWHDDPAQRFVTIHDRRIEDGGVVDRDLRVREIRPDGVVFQFREAFFFQPR